MFCCQPTTFQIIGTNVRSLPFTPFQESCYVFLSSFPLCLVLWELSQQISRPIAPVVKQGPPWPGHQLSSLLTWGHWATALLFFLKCIVTALLRCNSHTLWLTHYSMPFSGFQQIHRDVQPSSQPNLEYLHHPKETPCPLAVTPCFPPTALGPGQPLICFLAPQMCLCSLPCPSGSASSPRPTSTSLTSLPERGSGSISWEQRCRQELSQPRATCPFSDPEFLAHQPLALQLFSVSASFPLLGTGRVGVHLEGSFLFGELGNRVHGVFGPAPQVKTQGQADHEQVTQPVLQPLTLERHLGQLTMQESESARTWGSDR